MESGLAIKEASNNASSSIDETLDDLWGGACNGQVKWSATGGGSKVSVNLAVKIAIKAKFFRT